VEKGAEVVAIDRADPAGADAFFGGGQAEVGGGSAAIGVEGPFLFGVVQEDDDVGAGLSGFFGGSAEPAEVFVDASDGLGVFNDDELPGLTVSGGEGQCGEAQRDRLRP